MDEIVLRAIKKWPDVPSVYGWLALDRRGNWSIKGERIANSTITAFIGRNYAHDERGRWFFQNGPQRVFVTLAYTPLVLRTQGNVPDGPALIDHRGEPVRRARSAWLDESGTILVATDSGVGVIHDQDLPEIIACLVSAGGQRLSDAALDQMLMPALSDVPIDANLLLAQHAVPLSRIHSNEVPPRFGFDPNPRPAPGEPEC